MLGIRNPARKFRIKFTPTLFHFGMGTNRFATCTVLIAILLGGLMLVFAHRPTSPITVLHVKSIQTASGIRATFEISNHTASPYAVLPLEVEAHDGQTWRRCFFFVERLSSPSAISPYHVIGPYGFASRVYDLTNLPPEVPLRLRLFINQELTGVRGFWDRVQIRLRYTGHMSLNPFDKYTHVFDRNGYETTSEEFIEPKSQK